MPDDEPRQVRFLIGSGSIEDLYRQLLEEAQQAQEAEREQPDEDET